MSPLEITQSVRSHSGHRPYGILFIAVSTYLIWVLATFILEGRILTLLRPEAVTDRIIYTLIANILVGSLLALVVLRRAIKSHHVSPVSAGFGSVKRSIPAISIAFILGFIVLVLGQPASWDPVILLNIYAQVFTVTIAEIAVCWVVIGSITEASLPKKGSVAAACGIFVSGILFGIYHFAHSPPFNQLPTVAFLTVIGFITGIVYYAGRDVYATMVFHNFFGSIGVMQSLSASGILNTYSRPLVPVLGMAILSFLIFLFADFLLIRKQGQNPENAN